MTVASAGLWLASRMSTSEEFGEVKRGDVPIFKDRHTLRGRSVRALSRTCGESRN
jgi:hypothetical protein